MGDLRGSGKAWAVSSSGSRQRKRKRGQSFRAQRRSPLQFTGMHPGESIGPEGDELEKGDEGPDPELSCQLSQGFLHVL